MLAGPPSARAQLVIDLSASVLNLNGTLTTETGAAVVVPAPVGPFILDFDFDGILEADTNGNGLDRWDPELRDYSAPADGTRELPPDARFPAGDGALQFTTFVVPDDVFVEATGPLHALVAGDVLLAGTLRTDGDLALDATGTIASTGVLRVAGAATLRTALAGTVSEGLVAGGCGAALVTKTPFPAVGSLGLVTLAATAILIVTLAMQRRRRAAAARVRP